MHTIKRISRIIPHMERFLHARELFLRWRRDREACATIATWRYPLTHKVRKGLCRVLLGEPLGAYRMEADRCACLYDANAQGDPFDMDDAMRAPTDCFYGPRLRGLYDEVGLALSPHALHSKCLAAHELARFRELPARASDFMDAVEGLPHHAAGKRLVDSRRRVSRSLREVTAIAEHTEKDRDASYKVVLCCWRVGLTSDMAKYIYELAY